MEINETLSQFGLTHKKNKVYLASLELGAGTTIEIAKKAGIKRTTCYDVLLELEKDGLIYETTKNKKRFFVAEDPEKIQRDLKRKEVVFSEILPELKSIYNVKGVKPKIRFYEARVGLLEVYDDTLRYSGEILAFASVDSVNVLGFDWANEYLKKRVEKGIHYKGIIAKSKLIEERFLPENQNQLRSSKLINGQKYPFSNEIMIYGHQKVAIVSAKDLIGVIIESSEIYHTQKSIFNLLWDSLPEIKSEPMKARLT